MSLIDHINKTTELGYFEGKIPVNYQYTLGVGGDAFFRSIMEKGEFIASKCTSCGATSIYPTIYCEECFAEITEYISVGLEGELYSWTECREDFTGSRHQEPHLIGMVRFPNVGGAVVHRLNMKPEECRIGMRVKAALKPQKERTGGIDDILYFVKA